MDAIYACRLYKASCHKDKIHAGLADPLNAQLVQQLREYLDEDQFTDSDSESQTAMNNTRSSVPDDVPVDSKSAESSIPQSSPSHSDTSTITNEDVDDNYNPSSDIDDLTDEDNVSNTSDDDVDVEEVQSASITSSAETLTPETRQHTDDLADQIKDTLNSDKDTSSVIRISCKDSEIWIYYDDNTNLNRVMGPVIELIARHHPTLEFNRLARTSNAIVFQVED